MASIAVAIRYASNMAELANNLKQGTNQIEALSATAEKMAERLGGAKMIQAANNLVGALDKTKISTLTLAQSSSSLEQLERAIAKLEASGKPIPDGMLAAANALRQVTDQAKALSAQAQQTAQQTEAITAKVEELGGTKTIQSAKTLVTAINQVGVSVLSTSQAAGSLAQLDAAMAKLKATGQPIPASMQATADALKKVADQSVTLEQRLDATAKKLDTAGNAAKSVATTMAPVALALGGIGLAGIKMATDLNESLANVSALLGDMSGKQLDSTVGEMKSKVRDLAISLGKSTTDISGGLYEVVSSLGYTNDTFGQLEIAAKAGAAGLATTQESFNFLSAVTKTYGDTSEAAFKKAADLGFQAVNFGQTTFPQLAASIGGVAPIAKVAGVSMEEMFAVIATATGVTGNTNEVVTQMASAINGLLSPAKDMKIAYQALGVSSGEALIQQRGFVGALQAVAEQARLTGTPLIELLGRKEAFILTSSLAGTQAAKFADNLGEMAKAATASGGVVDSAFKKQTEGVNSAGFAWKQFKAEAEVASQRIGDAVLPVIMRIATTLKPAWEAVQSAVEWFGQLPAPVQATAVVLGGLVVVGVPLLYFMGQLMISVAALLPVLGVALPGAAVAATGAIGGTTIAVGGLKTALLAFAANPIVLALTAIATAAVLVYIELDRSTAAIRRNIQANQDHATIQKAASSNVALGIKEQAEFTAALERTTASTYIGGKGLGTLSGFVTGLNISIDQVDMKPLVSGVTGAGTGARQASPEMKKFADDVNDLKTKIANLTSAGVPASEIVKRLGDDAIKTANQAQEMGVRVDKLPMSIRLLKADAEALAKLLDEQKPFKKFADDAKDLEARLRALQSAGVPAAEIVEQLGKDALKSAEEARQLGLGVGSVSPAIIALGRDYVILTALQKVNDDVAKLTPKIVGDNVKATAEWVAARRKAEDDLLAKARATSAAVIAVGYTEVEKKVAAAGQWRDESLRAIEVLRTKEPEMHRAISEMIAKEYGKRTDAATSSIARIAEKIENIGATVANVGGQIASEMGGRWGAAVGHASAAFGAGAKSISSFMKGDILGGIQAGVAAVISFGKTISAVFGNETKGARDEFAKGMNMTLDQLMAKLQASGAKGQELANQALNVIGKHDVAANQAWMKEVSAFFEKTTADIQRTADVLAKYGAVWEQLPAALQAKSIAAEVKTLAEEHVILTANGYSTAAATTAQADAYNELLAKALKAGAEIPPAMLPALLRMAELGQMTEANMRAMLGLKDESLPDFKAMEEAAKKYGIELGDLGPKFQQAKLNDLFKGLLSDFTLLREGGANMAVVIEKMGPQVNDAVQQAIKFGTEIPASMRPMIEAMASAGQLVGENGEKLTDLGALKWATPIEESMKELVRLFKELITQMMGAKTAVEEIPTQVEVEVGWKVHAFPGVPGAAGAAGAAASAHSGALVTAGRIQRFHDGVARVLPFPRMASDEVPAILQTGEAVLRREAVSALGVDAVSALNDMGGRTAGASGGRGGNVVDLAAVTRELQSARLAQARRDAAMPQQIARAVRDEFQKVVSQ